MQSTHKWWIALGAVASLSLGSGVLAQTRQETKTESRSGQQQQGQSSASARSGQTGGMTLADHERDLTNGFKQVQDHAAFLQDEANKPEAFSKNVAMTHSQEIGRGLDQVETHYAPWRDVMKDDTRVQPKLARMDRAREEMRTQYQSLQNELQKDMPNPRLVGTYAKAIQDAAKDELDQLKATKK